MSPHTGNAVVLTIVLLFPLMLGLLPAARAADKSAAALKDATATNANLRLFWHQIGRSDSLLPEQRKFESVLEKHGIKRQFRVTAGDHSWDVWRGYLGEFLPLLFKQGGISVRSGRHVWD